MTKSRIILLTFILAACTAPDRDNSRKTNSTDTILLTVTASADTVSESKSIKQALRQVDTIITPRMLAFAKYLDSIKFNCDTHRIIKTYKHVFKNPKHFVDDYVFYSSTPKTSELITYFELFADDKRYEGQDWLLDEKKINNNQSILCYFFSEVKPEVYEKTKFYTDGIIEEWKFPDNVSAKTAAEEIGEKATRLYFNVGAFVCYVDNYMYIITSRSSGTMYALRPVFKRFTKDNAAIVTNKIKWY